MKGYMLQLSTGPVKPDTTVTWSIKKAGQEVGTYHAAGSWVSYQTTVPKPTARTVYWRSDRGGDISDTYDVSATYTPEGETEPVTLTRRLQSRSLNPDDPAHNSTFNEDVDMIQRGVIQIFGLDKGRLSAYQRGRYQDNSGNHFYITKRPGNPPWSKIADEVQNIDIFVNHIKPGSKVFLLRHVQAIWNEFDYILAAGAIGAVDNTNVNYSTWLDSAVSASTYSRPEGFPKTSAEVLRGLHIAESNGRHSYATIQPLAVNNVQVGEQKVGEPSDPNYHLFTDWGIGFAKVQPYNRIQGGTTYNLYKPDHNIIASASILKGFQAQTTSVPGPKAKVWHAIYGYNSGNVQAAQDPAALRDPPSVSSNLADRAFNPGMNLTPPDSNTE